MYEKPKVGQECVGQKEREEERSLGVTNNDQRVCYSVTVLQCYRVLQIMSTESPDLEEEVRGKTAKTFLVQPRPPLLPIITHQPTNQPTHQPANQPTNQCSKQVRMPRVR